MMHLLLIPSNIFKIIFHILLLSTIGKRFSSSKILTRYVPLKVNSKVYNKDILVPTVGSYELANPSDLFPQVKDVWDTVVEKNQAGLVDPKQSANALAKPQPLSEEEAWHHYKAGSDGIIDSARFLITFNLLPSIQNGGKPLHIAAIHNNYEKIHDLIENKNVDVDLGKKTDGLTALIIACTLGNIESIRTLIKHEADVELMSKNGITPLMAASSLGHVHVVDILLSAGASPETTHPFAKTSPLHFAAEMGNTEVIHTLCKYFPKLGNIQNKIGGTPLHTASDTNQSASVLALISESPCKSNTNVLMNQDTTPLYLAAQRGFHEIINILVLEGNADINFIMPTGKFKSEIQAYGVERAKYRYAQKNTEIGNGATALHAAVENGHLLAVRALLKLGAKQIPSMRGASPLLIALQYRHPRIAMALLSKNRKAHINLETKHDGMFPLFVASRYGYHKVVKRLLKRGANIKKKLNGQEYAALYATTSKRVKKILNDYLKKRTKKKKDVGKDHHDEEKNHDDDDVKKNNNNDNNEKEEM